MIQPVAICHRWIRNPPVDRLREAFLRETRIEFAPEPGSNLDGALLLCALGADAPTGAIGAVGKAVAGRVRELGNGKSGSTYLVSWGFLEAQQAPKGGGKRVRSPKR